MLNSCKKAKKGFEKLLPWLGALLFLIEMPLLSELVKGATGSGREISASLSFGLFCMGAVFFNLMIVIGLYGCGVGLSQKDKGKAAFGALMAAVNIIIPVVIIFHSDAIVGAISDLVSSVITTIIIMIVFFGILLWSL